MKRKIICAAIAAMTLVGSSRRDELAESGVIFVKGALPSVDFEPEYITATRISRFRSQMRSLCLTLRA